MTRRSFRKPAITLSLFPFLAVLVCTMGALIVLLVTVLQKAHVDAVTATAAADSASDDQEEQLAELRLQKEDHLWRRSELERQRTELQQKLGQQRLLLSHFEEHLRSLEEKWKQLQAQATDMERMGSEEAGDVDATKGAIAQLRSEIDRQRSEYEEAKKKAAGRQRAFAIIPYDGPNGTKRRPIYIECTDQGIILQPEGIVLSANDFEGSLGPGNPLDAALRTSREYLAKYAASTSREEPYPLLVVRPSGTIAYAVARAALKSWDDEFGYELVDAEMKLAYPKPDRTLKSELERSISDARKRQAILASMMPGRFKQAAGATGFVATTNGGFTPIGGVSSATRSASWSGPGGHGVSGPSGGFSDTFGSSLGAARDSSITMPGARPTSGQAGSGQAGSGQYAPGQQLAGQPGTGQQSSSTSLSGLNAFEQRSGGTGTASQSGSGSSSGASSSGQYGSTGASGPAGNPGGSVTAGGQTWQPGMPSPSAEATPGGNEMSSGKASKNGASAQGSSEAKPIAQYRGPEWGLPNRGPRSTGIQRYVQIQVLADRLVILQDRGDYRNPTVILMPDATALSVDPFVSAVWKRMEQWGLAGDECYWKPILRMQVSPDAESRFAELALLLEGSGLVVERKP